MNITKLIELLKEPENIRFFKKLQEAKLLTINDIQKLIEKNPDKPVRDMLSQIKLQKRNLPKNPQAFELLFTRKGAQQASSWRLAEYHAAKFKNYNVIADLCCGVGIDLINIAEDKEMVYAVDLNKETLKVSEHNTEVRKLKNIRFINAEAEGFSKKVEAIFIDPDRRIEEKRKIDAEEYSPTLKEILKLRAICPDIAVKLSPALNYNRLDLPEDSTLEFVSENGTLKEILLCMGKLSTNNCRKKAVLLPSKTTLYNGNAKIEVNDIQDYIFEPDPAVIRAGIVQELGDKISYELIDPKLALLTGSHIPDTQMGRLFKVISVMKYNLKMIRKYIRENEIGELIIKTRGFPETVEQFRKKLKLKGKSSIVMFILRIGDDHLIVFAKPI